jgi:hypothetical protein
MSDAPKAAQSDNQAETNTAASPYHDYLRAAGDVVMTIGARDETHGDPEAFGVTFARFLNAYLTPIVAAGRQLGAADAFTVLDLMKTARIAVGGAHPDHFRDKAGYGLLGMVHVQRAFAYVQAQREATEPQAEPEAADDAKAEPTPQEAPRGARKPAPAPETPADDPEDADLLRWALNPEWDPFADLIDDDGEMRPGVTTAQLMNRQARVIALLRKAPEGVERTEALDRYTAEFMPGKSKAEAA